MVYLTLFNNKDKIFEFSDNILKTSIYLNNISKAREDINEPLPLIKCDEKIFDIFKGWFEIVERNFLNDCSMGYFVYRNYFINYDIITLVNVFNFALANTINSLVNDVSSVLSFKVNNIHKYKGNFYLQTDEIVENSTEVCFKSVCIQCSLAILIVKYMSYQKYKTLSPEIKSLSINQEVTNFEDYIPDNDLTIVSKSYDFKQLEELYKIWNNEIYQLNKDYTDLIANYALVRTWTKDCKEIANLDESVTNGRCQYHGNNIRILNDFTNKVYDYKITFKNFIQILISNNENLDNVIDVCNNLLQEYGESLKDYN